MGKRTHEKKKFHLEIIKFGFLQTLILIAFKSLFQFSIFLFYCNEEKNRGFWGNGSSISSTSNLKRLHFKELTSPLQLLMFVTAEKEGQMFITFFPFLVNCFKQGYSERVQAMKAHTSWPRSQLFLI